MIKRKVKQKMKIDPREYEFGAEDENMSFSHTVKNKKKKQVPNEFRKVNNKKLNKPKHINNKGFDD